MPFTDPDERRRYDRERKRSLRASAGPTPVVLPAAARLRVADDIESLLAEGVRLVLTDQKARGTEKARALGYLCTVGLRLIEANDLARRLESLEDVLRTRGTSAP